MLPPVPRVMPWPSAVLLCAEPLSYWGHHPGDRPPLWAPLWRSTVMPLPGALLAAPPLLSILQGVSRTLAQLRESEYLIFHNNSFRLFAIPLLRWWIP